ncbi:SMP-30/gluconolactonase/LRE family protein [Donghicola mangrovi]|uniref:SMP-30/gluconolactonase/LRE family protein n=1 Tax=Donghicola mangrovi TaxID=2729614 RepID=A0A850QHZ8_9RHOB|nr:SMP-30/gluconolactonase/LRE family protein [Donghicola mangrovi]NVO25421.1 SMP-30/gluconolactonase/LRE family protein [Donghicola mangrovi]
MTDAKLLAGDFKFLEAPKWRDDRLWVSDVFDEKVFSVGLDGSREVVAVVPGRPAGQDFLPDGRHVVISGKDGTILEVKNGTTEVYADLNGLRKGNLNDFAIDAQGRIYVGDFGYDYDSGEEPAPTKLFRVDLDKTVSIAAEGVNFPNGSVILNDGQLLVVNETWEAQIVAYDIAADGTLSNRRIFADLASSQPDGMCADAEGGVWVGCFNTGEFLRVLDGGEITDRFQFDGRAISCTLGGKDGKMLFMTVFEGPVEEIATDARKSAIYMAQVKVAGA